MYKTENTELTVLCLIRDKKTGHVLLENRVSEIYHGYALPGGHIDPGESAVEAVMREMREETGLTIKNPRISGIKHFPCLDGRRYIVFVFTADEYEGELTSSDEGEVVWADVSGIPESEKVFDLDALIELAESPDKSELCSREVNGEYVSIVR